MAFRQEAFHVTGHTAVDDHGERVGTVTDVLFDDTGEPAWATVKPGVLRREHYVPLDGAYETQSGDLMLAVSKGTVDHAPAAGRDHILTREVLGELEEHYGLN